MYKSAWLAISIAGVAYLNGMYSTAMLFTLISIFIEIARMTDKYILEW